MIFPPCPSPIPQSCSYDPFSFSSTECQELSPVPGCGSLHLLPSGTRCNSVMTSSVVSTKKQWLLEICRQKDGTRKSFLTEVTQSQKYKHSMHSLIVDIMHSGRVLKNWDRRKKSKQHFPSKCRLLEVTIWKQLLWDRYFWFREAHISVRDLKDRSLFHVGNLTIFWLVLNAISLCNSRDRIHLYNFWKFHWLEWPKMSCTKMITMHGKYTD